jgi:hypothetical protein
VEAFALDLEGRTTMKRMIQTKEYFARRDVAFEYAKTVRTEETRAVLGSDINGHTVVTILEPDFIGPLHRGQRYVYVAFVGGSLFYA